MTLGEVAIGAAILCNIASFVMGDLGLGGLVTEHGLTTREMYPMFYCGTLTFEEFFVFLIVKTQKTNYICTVIDTHE